MNIGPWASEFVRGTATGAFAQDLEFSVSFLWRGGEKQSERTRGREPESLRAKVQFQDSLLKSHTLTQERRWKEVLIEWR